MKENPAAESAVEAAKVFVGILLALVIEPLLSGISKEVPSWVWFVASGAISAALMGLLYFFIFRKAIVSFAWTTQNDPDPQVQVSADINRASQETRERVRVEARLQLARGLGGCALTIAAKRGLTIEVVSPHSQLSVTVEDSDLDADSMPLTNRNPGRCAFMMTLPPPPSSSSWGRAFVRFTGRIPASRTTDIQYFVHVAGSRRIARVCEMLIHVDSRATALRERWS